MAARKITLALFAVTALSGSACFAQDFNFLSPGKVELTKLLPPPPALGSEAEKQDMAGVLEVQKTRTPQQSKRALQDNRLSIYVYDDVLGIESQRSKPSFFVTARFLQDVGMPTHASS